MLDLIVDMEKIKQELKEVIIRSLRISDYEPMDLKDDEPLFAGGLDIDSVDILQLIVDIERKFGVKLLAGRFERSVWENVTTLATAIQAMRSENDLQ